MGAQGWEMDANARLSKVAIDKGKLADIIKVIQ